MCALLRALLLRAPERADARAAAVASVQELVGEGRGGAARHGTARTALLAGFLTDRL